MPHHYTKEQAAFIRENVKGRSSNELTQLINDHFGLNLGVNQIRAYMKNHGLTNGVNKQFKQGYDAWNKGLKGLNIGGKETQFKTGQRSHNYMPVGSERVNTDGYVDIKIADPNKWKAKHQIIWEQENGPIPKGHCLIFLDSNKLNVTLDNLKLISRSQLVRLNQNHLISENPELTKTGLLITDIYMKIGELKKSK